MRIVIAQCLFHQNLSLNGSNNFVYMNLSLQWMNIGGTKMALPATVLIDDSHAAHVFTYHLATHLLDNWHC